MESVTEKEDGKAQEVQRFLVCAEARYIQYLMLLDEFFRQVRTQGSVEKSTEMIPLPPWFASIKKFLILGMSRLYFMHTVFLRFGITQIYFIAPEDINRIYGVWG